MDKQKTEYARSKVRHTENVMMRTLMEHCYQHCYDKELLEDAWVYFWDFSEEIPLIEEERLIYEQTFLVWFLFDWVPEESLQQDYDVELPKTTIAKGYLDYYLRALFVDCFETNKIPITQGPYQNKISNSKPPNLTLNPSPPSGEGLQRRQKLFGFCLAPPLQLLERGLGGEVSENDQVILIWALRDWLIQMVSHWYYARYYLIGLDQ